jgi:hypothetical protein
MVGMSAFPIKVSCVRSIQNPVHQHKTAKHAIGCFTIWYSQLYDGIEPAFWHGYRFTQAKQDVKVYHDHGDDS